MRLILARHGNTFAPGDKVVWVGRGQDLPLVAKGEEQARRLGRALAGSGLLPAAIYCGPLQRTRRHAEILIEESGLDRTPVVDQRLVEIDYGRWGGLSNDEIVARFGKGDFEAWQTESRWPDSAGWQPGKDEILAAIRSLVDEILGNHVADDRVVLVSSNGVLRYFLDLVPGGFEHQMARGGVKVSTGHICELQHGTDGLEALSWNRDPDAGLML